MGVIQVFQSPSSNRHMVCSLTFFEMRQGKDRHVHNTSIVVFQNIRIPHSERMNGWEYRNRVYHVRFVRIVHKLV